jgi:hypothetical protein
MLSVFLVACALMGAADLPGGDLHLVLDASSARMGRARTSQVEHWIGADRRARKEGEALRIVRQDQGVAWSVNLGTRSYTERPADAPEPARSRRAEPVERPTNQPADMRTLGYDFYVPKYDWEVKPASGTKTIAGCLCSGLLLDGDAEYADLRLTVWVCPAATDPQPERISETVLASLDDKATRTAVLSAVRKAFPKGAVFGFEAVQEDAIVAVR